jgi:hypothetical protein
MTETQEKKAISLLLDVLYAQLGGHLDPDECAKALLDDIRRFLFKELKINPN